jgi:hypothetical protein
VSEAEALRKAVCVLARQDNGALIVLTDQGSREGLGRPTTTPAENKQAIMTTFEHEA